MTMTIHHNTLQCIALVTPSIALQLDWKIWEQAEELCMEKGGHLASIPDQVRALHIQPLLFLYVFDKPHVKELCQQ